MIILEVFEAKIHLGALAQFAAEVVVLIRRGKPVVEGRRCGE